MGDNNLPITSEDIRKYEEALEEVECKLASLLTGFCSEKGVGFIAAGRIKSDDSINQKINSKKKGNVNYSKNDISDIAGYRVVFGHLLCFGPLTMEDINNLILGLSGEQLKALVAGLKAFNSNCNDLIIREFVSYIKNNTNFVVEEEIDYISKCKDSGYQSFHLVVIASNGFKVEIQIRNIVQHVWAEHEHEMVYKNSDSNTEKIDYRALACSEMESSISGHQGCKVLSYVKTV